MYIPQNNVAANGNKIDSFTTWHDVISKRSNSAMNLGVLICSILFGLSVTSSGFRGISVPIVIILFYIVLFAYFKRYKQVFKPISIFITFVNIIVSCSFIYVDSMLSHYLAKLLLIVLIPFHIVYMSGYSKMFSLSTIYEIFYSLFGKFFVCIPAISGIFVSGSGNVKKKKAVFYTVLGLIVALPAAVILMLLLMGANEKFRYWVTAFWNIIELNFNEIFWGLAIGIIVWLITVIWLTAVQTERTSYQPKLLNGYIHGMAVFAFLIPLVAVEAVFIAAEISSYTLTGSFSEYARSSFGYSAAAMVYTTVILTLVFYLCKKNAKNSLPFYVKAIMSIQLMCTGLISITALYRMLLYIDKYGLTLARICVTVISAATVAVLFFLLIKVWIKNFCFAACASVSVIIACMVLILCHPDYLCAKYNVDKYFADFETEGEKADIDLEYLSNLSPATVIQLERLVKYSEDPLVVDEAKYIISRKNFDEIGYAGFCITDKYAHEIINDPANSWELYDELHYRFNNSYAEAMGYIDGREALEKEHSSDDYKPSFPTETYGSTYYDYGYDEGFIHGQAKAEAILDSIVSEAEEKYGNANDYIDGYTNGFSDALSDTESSGENFNENEYLYGYSCGYDNGYTDVFNSWRYSQY